MQPETWGPAQLAQGSRLVMVEDRSLALVQELNWDRPGASHHLMQLPPGRWIARGTEDTVRSPAIVLIGAGAVEIYSDITNSTEGEPGADVRRTPRCEAVAVQLPAFQYHSGLASLFDEFPQHTAAGGRCARW